MQLNTMEDFQRDITYRLLKQEDGTARLTALMKDRFHDVEVTVVVNAESLEIVSTAAEFRRSPTTDCCNVSRRLEGLIGFVIGKGLNKKVVEVLGGGEGCGNVRNLLLGLLPLALNLKASAGIYDEREMLDMIHEKLMGSCAGYQNPVPKR
ncbi:hypothetical protein GMSM_28640 [Geomonas sp. Red276]